jgi:hypothetical protein
MNSAKQPQSEKSPHGKAGGGRRVTLLSPWFWLKTHPFTVVGAILLCCVGVSFCKRNDSEWEEVYLRAAQHLWYGQELYRIEDGYLYPPFMACASLPFLLLPGSLRRIAWLLLNAICLLVVFRGGWRLAGGRRMEGPLTISTRERWAALLGCLCGISYLQNCLAHQQSDVLIAAALVVGCRLLCRGNPILAATAFGWAAACKCTALLWTPYLLWRGRPLAAAWLVIVAVGLNLLPNCASKAPTGRSWFAEYSSHFLLPLTANDHYVGTWGSDPVYNQSLTGLAQRWCTTEWTWGQNDCTVGQRLPLLRPQVLRVCVYACQLTMLATVLWVCARPFRPIEPENAESRQVLECGMVIALMLLLSPMSSKAHFGTLIVPGFCLARLALTRRSRILGAVVAGAVVLGLLCNKDPLGERLYTLSLWFGLVTWQTLLLLGGCLIGHLQFNRQRITRAVDSVEPSGAASHAA